MAISNLDLLTSPWPGWNFHTRPRRYQVWRPGHDQESLLSVYSMIFTSKFTKKCFSDVVIIFQSIFNRIFWMYSVAIDRWIIWVKEREIGRRSSTKVWQISKKSWYTISNTDIGISQPEGKSNAWKYPHGILILSVTQELLWTLGQHTIHWWLVGY